MKTIYLGRFMKPPVAEEHSVHFAIEVGDMHVICNADFTEDKLAKKFADLLLKDIAKAEPNKNIKKKRGDVFIEVKKLYKNAKKLTKKPHKVFGKAPKNRQMVGVGAYFNNKKRKNK